MKKLILILLCIGLLSLPVSGMAATEAEKYTAIANGLSYLAGQQQPDGSFYANSGYPVASTASALLAFEEQYYKQGNTWGTLNGGLGYGSVVTNAANYLLNHVSTTSIATPNFWGFNGTSGYGSVGAYWDNGQGEEAYQTGLALPAIARLTNGINGISPSTVIGGTGPLVGQTYLNAIQRVVDQITWSQTGPAGGVYEGGWHYLINNPQTDADNSTAQWPVVGLTFAKAVPGVQVYSKTATELQKWINAIQDASGGSAYTPGYLVDESKTGGLLVEMKYAGGGGNMALALAYLNANWQNGAGSHDYPWGGNFGAPYAMWSIYKGLEETIGLDAGTSVISNLNPNPLDVNNPNHGWNWWEDYCNWLVLNQQAGGYWNGFDSYWFQDLATAWYINILNGTAVGPGPSVPEPATLLLLGSGLLGLAGYARKRMKK